MTPKNKKLLIISGCVSAAGLIALLILGIYTKFDLKKLNSTAYKEKTYKITESFSNIKVDTADCDVEFVISESESIEITCINPGKTEDFYVKDDTLNIISGKKKSGASLFNPSFDFSDGKADITVSIPNRKTDLLSVKTSGGNVSISEYFNVTATDVTLESDGGSILYGSGASGSITADCKDGKIELINSKCGSVSLKLTAGEVVLTDVESEGDADAIVKSGTFTVSNLECNNFNAESESGKLDLSGVKSAILLNIYNGSGDAEIKESDANIVNIKNNSGSVKAEFLTDKIFTTDSTDGGKINIPDPISDLAGKCVIETKSGNVKCTIAG